MIYPKRRAVAQSRSALQKGSRSKDGSMAKAISWFLLAVMVVQIIYPLGLPGLKKRGDFWKVALAAIFVMMLTVLIRPA